MLLCVACLGSAWAADGGQWVVPSGFEDPSGLWMDPSLAYDGSTASYASDDSNAAGDGPWLVLDYSPTIHSNQIQLVADYGYDVVDAVALEAEVQGAWVPLFDGAIDNDSAFIITFPTVDADAFRFRFHYLTGGYYFWLYDFRAYSLLAQVSLPQVATTGASAVTDVSAVLHGQVTSDGGAPCSVAFAYQPAAGGTVTTTGWVSAVTTGQGASSVLLPIAGLQSGVAYTYHIIAQNSAGVVTGPDVAFAPQAIVPGSVEWLPGTDIHPEATVDMTWANPASAIDDDRSTAATCYHPLWTDQWTPNLVISLPAVAIDHVRLSGGVNPYIDGVAVDIQQADSTWTAVYQGAFTDQDWQVYALSATAVYPQARVRFHLSTTAVGTATQLFEFQVRMPPLLSFAANADTTVTGTGHVDLPLRLQPATSTLPIAVTLSPGGTAVSGTDWQFTSIAGAPPSMVIPAGTPAPAIGVDILAGSGTGTLPLALTLASADTAQIVAPATATISIVRSPPPPPPTFTQRRSPLNARPVEAFDATRWANDSVYRSAYLAATVPERVWETLPPGAAAPRLGITGSAYQRGAVGSTVTLTCTGVPNAPVTWLVDKPEVAANGTTAVQTATFQADGTLAFSFAIAAVGQARLLIGSPASVGTLHVVIEGVMP